MDRNQFIKEIQSNIDSAGHHVTIVIGGPEPRYAYTIGLWQKVGAELILAGGIYYLRKDIFAILNGIANDIQKINKLEGNIFNINSIGNFKLQKSHPSWNRLTMLGVYDFYNLDNFISYQVLPDNKHFTLDIPDMSQKWAKTKEPAWRWLNSEWEYEVPEKATVITDLNALKGESIKEVMRWEREEWEMFSESNEDTNKEDIRVVPLGLMLSIDKSLTTVLDLEIGKGRWRVSKGTKWNDWS